MYIPSYVLKTLQRLENAGFEAYVVGGCVRDSILGLAPHDFDVCTSALPQDVLQIFSAEKVIPTGIDHGTITVIMDETPVEITTYRTECEYRDHRHPESVEFVNRLKRIWRVVILR